MEDAIRDAVIKNGGLLPAIGTAVVICAIFGWMAWKLKDEYGFLAGLCVVVALGACLYAVVGYPIAQARCRSLAASSFSGYIADKCDVITHCHETFVLNPSPGRVLAAKCD